MSAPLAKPIDDLEDLIAVRESKRAHGKRELIPAEIVNRLLAGEPTIPRAISSFRHLLRDDRCLRRLARRADRGVGNPVL